ncbi:hypothetical protein LIER_12893 [Lithospermum erythrorhizon]|uniref:Uncharacterized protein n=1 Tax=Lithospermum erythrorhizon TaxID=34254 RepID=A0AAV3PTF6_LITER
MMGRKWFREVDDLKDPVFSDDDDDNDDEDGDDEEGDDDEEEGQATLMKENKKIKKYVKGLMKFLSCFGDANEMKKANKNFLGHSDDEDEVEATTLHPATSFAGIEIDDYLIGDDDDDDMGQFFESGGGGPKIN